MNYIADWPGFLQVNFLKTNYLQSTTESTGKPGRGDSESGPKSPQIGVTLGNKVCIFVSTTMGLNS